MKTQYKFLNIFYCLLICLCSFCILLPACNVTSAETTGYYYQQLSSSLSQKFYQAIASMENNNLLMQGNAEFDLLSNNILSQSQISNYQNGDSQLLKEFGAGRDAYMLDHTDNFYTDFSKLSISIGTKNGSFVATLGTGRADNYYIENSFNNQSEILLAKESLTNKINTILGDYQNFSTLEKIELANQLVATNTKYTFCNTSQLEQFAPQIRTAYGAIVNGYAVCEGYARALKMLLDKMQVNNVLVNGYLMSSSGSFESHMWNYVQLDNKWYAIDPTLNSSNGEKFCFLQGSETFNYDHFEQGQMPESGAKFSYPVISQFSYGNEKLPTVVTYPTQNDSKMLNVCVSYNNKNASNLAQDGLYLAFNYSTQTSTSNNIEWTNYVSISQVISDGLWQEVVEETANYSVFKDYGSTPFIKFAVITKAPDQAFGKYGELDEQDILCESDIIVNDLFDGNVASPFAFSVSPQNTAKLDVNKSYHMVFKYDEQLVVTNDSNVDISVATTHGASLGEYQINNIVWNSETNELSFDFTPSKMFIHNGDGYNFTPTNLIGEKSKKQPYAVSYSFQYSSIVCNKILDGCRLYMDVYGHPNLIDNQDLSVQNWTIDGNVVGQNQRSQLALVVTNTSTEDSNKMAQSIVETQNIEASQVLSASTYEISLDLCGFLKSIPSGSYMKVSFGFPAGYSAKDKGVTFKLYHFKRDSFGNIDPSLTTEIPCVITEYGLIAEINEFSPFAVVALKDVKDVVKGIYSRTIGTNGSIKLSNSNSNLAFVENGESVTFDVLPNAGYILDYVLLNQKEIKVTENKITLDYESLQNNNLLEVSFISTRVEQYEKANNIVNLQKNFNLNYNNADSSSTAVFTCVVLTSAVCCCIVVFIIVLSKKRKNS